MLIDITRPIGKNMAIYPGNPDVEIEQIEKASDSTSALTKIIIGSHTGTHIDAPSHVKEGSFGTSTYALEQLIGDAEVVEVNFKTSNLKPQISDEDQSSNNVITAENLPPTSAERVLIKTANSSGDIDTFYPDFVALDDLAAIELVNRKIKLIGIDGPSIKKKGVRDRTHEILLDAGIVILEGLWLAEVEIGSYELMCLPLPLDLDGAPVRAVLRS